VNRFTEEEIAGFLRDAAAGASVEDLCRRHGIPAEVFREWECRTGGGGAPDKKLEALEAENARLWKALADSIRIARGQG
jgi:putative transposase